MIQEAKGQEYGVGSGGLGAVYAPESKVIDIMEKTNDDIKDYAVLRQREKAQHQADAQALYTSLAMKEAQVRPADEQYFKQKTQDIFSKFSQALAKYNGDTSNPQFQQEMAKIRGEKEAAEIGLQASAGAYKNYLELLKTFDAEKDDPSILEDAKRALAMSPQDAWEKGGAATWNFVKQPRQLDLNTIITKRIMKDVKPTTTSTTKLDPTTGAYLTESEEGYTPTQIKQVAKTSINDPYTLKEIQTAMGRMSADEIANIQKQAAEETAKEGYTVTPHELILRDAIDKTVGAKSKIQNHFYSPWQQEAAKYQFSTQKQDDDAAKYLSERLDALMSTDPEKMGKVYDRLGETMSSNVLKDWKMGEKMVPVYVKYDGSNTPEIKEYQPVKDYVVDIKRIGKKTYVLTRANQMTHYEENKYNDPQQVKVQNPLGGYVEITPNSVDMFTAGMGNPLKYADAIRKGMIERGVYSEGIVKSTNKPQQQAKQQTQPTNKVAAKGYRIGEIQGGYRYTGGDPTDSKNWEKQ